MATEPARCLVLGVGNLDRGDDAAGRVVARRLRGALPTEIEVAEVNGETAMLLEKLDGAADAYLVDACASGAPPGTIRRFDLHDAPLPQGLFGLSTHGLGLAEAIELARALGQLPPRCILYAIEGACFDVGASLSPSVADAVDEAAERLRVEIVGARELGRTEPCTKHR